MVCISIYLTKFGPMDPRSQFRCFRYPVARRVVCLRYLHHRSHAAQESVPISSGPVER